MDPQAFLNPLGVDPFALLPQNPDAGTLLEAASRFPGGPVALVFILFWSPWMAAIGIPAGLLLARHADIHPVVTFGLYAITDVLAALVTHPLYAFLKRVGQRNRILRAIGRVYLRVAMLGVRPPRIDDVRNGPILPALFRIGVIAFGFDIYHGGMVIAGLPVPRLLGWLAAIAGDLIWFATLMAANSAAAALTSDDRMVTIVTLVAMLVIPKVAERIFPALRAPAAPATTATTDGTASPVTDASPGLATTPSLAMTTGAGIVSVGAVPVARIAATPATGAPRRKRGRGAQPPPRSR